MLSLSRRANHLLLMRCNNMYTYYMYIEELRKKTEIQFMSPFNVLTSDINFFISKTRNSASYEGDKSIVLYCILSILLQIHRKVLSMDLKELPATLHVVTLQFEWDSPMPDVQVDYLIIVDPHPQEDIRAFSVVVLTSEPGLTTAQFQKVRQHLQSIALAVAVV